MIVGGHPWIRLAMVCVRQGGGSANHKEKGKKVLMEIALKSLKTLLDMGYDKFLLPFVDMNIHVSQNIIFNTSIFM